MSKWWTFLNGKKTSIGAAMLLLAILIGKLSGIWLDSGVPDWIPKLIETLEYFGGALTGVGLGHKGVKVLGK